MPVPPYSEAAEKRDTVLQSELARQTDRGVAIVAAASVDEAITLLLESCLIKHKEAWKRLLGSGGSLESLSNRIDLITLLGLISPGIRSDLHTIRDIRNEFAHQIAHKSLHHELTFQSPHIRDKCNSLRSVQGDQESPRVRYIENCRKLVAEFEMVWMFGVEVHDIGRIHLPGESAA